MDQHPLRTLRHTSECGVVMVNGSGTMQHCQERKQTGWCVWMLSTCVWYTVSGSMAVHCQSWCHACMHGRAGVTHLQHEWWLWGVMGLVMGLVMALVMALVHD